MAVNTKAIQNRIKSIKNTKKITKAMEMISAVKMRKATEAAVNTRTYAQMAWDLLVNLSKTERKSAPLLQVRKVKKMLVILITSNRGLCGSFNSSIIKKLAKQMENPKVIATQREDGKEIEPEENMEIEVIGIGKKGARFAKKMDYNLIASYSDFSDTPTWDDVVSISKVVLEKYKKKEYDKVVVAYTNFKSAVLQEPVLKQVLPVSEPELEKVLDELGRDLSLEPSKTAKAESESLSDYVFEPSKAEVLKMVTPRLVETQIYQSVLESAASEHSARMMAMRSAGDAAGDMIKELTLNFNKARQASITQEIAEIAGGAAALE